MTKKLLALIAICLVALGVAACGGSGSTTSTANTTTTVVTPPSPLKGIACDKQHNYAMQCAGSAALAAPNAGNPLLSGRLTATPVTYGTDTYGGAAQVASSSLTNFNCSYLSGSNGGKDWTVADINAWHAQGKPTCVVFEQGATQAEDGYDQGVRDAQLALHEANELGVPTYVPIHFAVDTDASGASVLNYFKGTKAILGYARNGAYGSYFVIRDLVEWGVIPNSGAWQTRAWSQGLVDPDAAIYQYAIPPMSGTFINSTGVDRDFSRGAFYGQWPYKAAPPVNPLHYNWLPNIKHTFKVGTKGHKKTIKARERLAAHTFDNLGCVLDKSTHHFKRHECKVKAQHLRLLAGRLYTVAHRTPDLKHKVKKPRWGALHYVANDKHKTTLGGAYRQMHRRITATGPIKAW